MTNPFFSLKRATVFFQRNGPHKSKVGSSPKASHSHLQDTVGANQRWILADKCSIHTRVENVDPTAGKTVFSHSIVLLLYAKLGTCHAHSPHCRYSSVCDLFLKDGYGSSLKPIYAGAQMQNSADLTSNHPKVIVWDSPTSEYEKWQPNGLLQIRPAR